jgi:predicted DNA-binding protein (UPF0251 family)
LKFFITQAYDSVEYKRLLNTTSKDNINLKYCLVKISQIAIDSQHGKISPDSIFCSKWKCHQIFFQTGANIKNLLEYTQQKGERQPRFLICLPKVKMFASKDAKMETLIKISTKEISRQEVMQRLSKKEIDQKEAGEILHLSTRQVKRLLRRYAKQGAQAWSQNIANEKAITSYQKSSKKTLDLLKSKYQGFGPTLAHEKLVEKEKK